MSFLAGVLVQIGEWLLAKVGAFLLLWGKKEVAALEEKKTEDAAVKELQDAKTLEATKAAETKLLDG